MHAMDPIFVAPLRVEHAWGRITNSDWTRGSTDDAPIGELRLLDSSCGAGGRALGRLIATDASRMLGDLGRAPPSMRLVLPAVETSIASTTPVSLWTIVDAGTTNSALARADVYRTGDRVRAYEGAAIQLPAGSVALEVSGSFQPSNAADERPWLVRLPPVSRRQRATLMRDPALSVEIWTLPQTSWIKPDGETCHVITALSDDITLDGRVLRRGEAVFIPAWGRPAELRCEEGRLLVAYPDQTPTTIWRHAPGPDPQSGRLALPEPVPFPMAAAA